MLQMRNVNINLQIYYYIRYFNIFYVNCYCVCCHYVDENDPSEEQTVFS